MKTRRTPKAPTMHPTQQRYALALAAYETALAAANREAREAPRGAPVEVQRAADAAYDAARARHRVDELQMAMHAAAEAMIVDRTEALCRQFPERAAEIRETRALAKRYPLHAHKLVDLCFRAA